MRKLFLIPLIAFFAVSNVAAQQNSFKTIDIMDDFWRFWDKAHSVDESTRNKLYLEMVIAPHKEIFAGFTGDRSDESLTKYFQKVEKIIPIMRRVNTRLGTELSRHEATFVKAFPDMNWKGNVVFMPNYGITDSGTGRMNEVDYLLFGVDTISATYGESADLAALFHHELFHMYHSQFPNETLRGKNREKGEIPLYWLIWGEGLATYVSHRLNPNATIEQVLLDETLAGKAKSLLPALSKNVRENIDSGKTETWKPFMSGGKNDQNIPPRSGYYIGYLIASELGKKHSMQQLAKLQGEDLKKKMIKVLTKLEKQSVVKENSK